MTAIIGLTGGIGSGKSTVARLFEKLGAVLIDSDAIVHELQAPGAPLLEQIAEVFGRHLIDERGALDRKALGALVFRDEQMRLRLNALVHPAVGAETLRRVVAARDAGTSVVVIDIPLLFESRRSGRGGAALMDFQATVVVWVPEAVQVERTMARDACTREEALRRVRAQMPLSEKRALADYVIDNSGAPEDTERQVREVFDAIRAAAD
jgi:dephospho-CoA kinase